jgi:ADP-ribose pyrophosphatase
MDKEKTLSTDRIFEGQIVNLRVDRVRMPDGRESTREVIEHSACVAIIPIDTEDNVLLVRQYRYAPEKELLEIPAGGIDGDENPEEAVRREMQEETGYLPGSRPHSQPAICRGHRGHHRDTHPSERHSRAYRIREYL